MEPRPPVDVVLTWSLRPSHSRAPGAVLWAVACASSTRIRFAVPCSSYGWPPPDEDRGGEGHADRHRRARDHRTGRPGPARAAHAGGRTTSTMTAALLALGDWLASLGVT